MSAKKKTFFFLHSVFQDHEKNSSSELQRHLIRSTNQHRDDDASTYTALIEKNLLALHREMHAYCVITHGPNAIHHCHK